MSGASPSQASRHRWKPNRVHDIDALASTVPYCDVVVTDKEAASHLAQTGVAGRFQTTVLSRVEDLIPLIGPGSSQSGDGAPKRKA